MNTVNTGKGLKVRAHKGDAMTLLAFDLAESNSQNFTGFTIRITAGTRAPYYMTNLLKYPAAILKENNIKSANAGSTLYAPIQKYRWVHVPATFHQIQSVFYGTYTYDFTPRYLVVQRRPDEDIPEYGSGCPGPHREGKRSPGNDHTDFPAYGAHGHGFLQ